jgi:hypothetical protein
MIIDDQEVVKKILKHLGLWELTPRPPPRMAKSQPLSTEPHIDYSDSQVPPSDNGLYHLAFIQNNRYVFGAEEHHRIAFHYDTYDSGSRNRSSTALLCGLQQSICAGTATGIEQYDTLGGVKGRCSLLHAFFPFDTSIGAIAFSSGSQPGAPAALPGNPDQVVIVVGAC